MKKILFFAVAVLGMLTACNPSKDDISSPGNNLTADGLIDGLTITQYSDENYTIEAADGNYFMFSTNPSRVVEIYQLDADGAKNTLIAGAAAGKFKIVPKRGNPTEQTFYIKTLNYDGSEISASKTVNVYVPSELSGDMRLLASDAYGSKKWYWDTDFRASSDGAVWGNVGYAAGDDWTSGIWWGTNPEGLTDQLQHSDTHIATGEESVNAYMELFDDGNIITYDAGGNQIRSGKYSVEGWTGEKSHASIDGSIANWSYGTLKTTEGAILFPFKINGNGTKPTDFEIIQLDANHLKLIYAAEGTGGWGEATWWAFKSASDAEGNISNYSTKSWTWDTEFREDGAVWGNLGYAAGDDWSGGIWWGAKPEELTGQLQHSDTGKETGEESADAYMTFDWNAGVVKSYDAAGTEIRSGKFEIANWGNGEKTQSSVDGSITNWAYGTLITDEGSILFPFKINGGGTKPTDFEIIQLDANHLKLIYAAEGTGGWGEATWWAFKAK